MVLIFIVLKFQKASKSKKKWFGKEKQTLPDSSTVVTATVSPPRPALPVEEVKFDEVEEEQTKHAYSIAVATAAAAEAAVAAAHAAAEVVRLTTVNQFTGKSNEEVAAIRVQTAFRGYLVCFLKIIVFFLFYIGALFKANLL